ncbi:MAG: polysaccharide biosynthesis/export family protein [Gemmataceae bacterium]
MAVKRRGKLLAGVAALLGLCLAGSGCRSSMRCANCAPGGAETPAAGVASSAGGVVWRPSGRYSPSRPLRDAASSGASTPVAVVLRPVPLAAPVMPDATNAVQQVSAEMRPLHEITLSPVVSLEKPQMASNAAPPVAPVEPSLQPLPVPLVAADPEKIDPPAKDSPKNGSSRGRGRNGNGTKDHETLPAPREVANGKRDAAYPAIPAPVITHPAEAPREFQKRALSSYIIEPPDILQIEGSKDIGDPNQPITGPHLVRPDGTVGLGSYGSVFVAGMTIEQAKMQIVEKIRERQPKAKPQDLWEGLKVDVMAYNSKWYYVIADGGGYGETVVRIPITGNETVLDAISQIQGLPVVASKKHIWVARATPGCDQPVILPVDWCRVTQGGKGGTNFQLFPGDRIYVNSDVRIRVDSNLAKIISPIERLFGITLLGATTVNAIKGNQGGGIGR